MTELASRFKDQFSELQAGGVFLNSASVGPMPKSSVMELGRGNADRADPIRWTQERMNGVLADSRELCARLIGAEKHEIALMPNTTTGLNIAARALPLSRRSVVLTFDGEFPSNIYPWLARANEGVVLERIPRTIDGWPDEQRLMERIADPDVAAVCVSLVQFSNGYAVDLEQLSKETRRTGKWLVIDAIQGVGTLPLDLSRTPVDFLACGSQKWLLSPWGTGFLYVRKELISQIQPTFAGWAAYVGSDDYTNLTGYNPEPWPDARRFELITLPVQDLAAMNDSLGLILGVGVNRIREHIRSISEPIFEWARQGGGSITSPEGLRASAITCIRPREEVRIAYQKLVEAGIVCSLREGAIRLSPHLFNTTSDLERVIEVLG